MSGFYICACYFSHNIFLKTYNLHVIFNNETDFLKRYGEALQQSGCNTAEKLKDVLTTIQSELDRRTHRDRDRNSRCALIAQKYSPLHTAAYYIKESYLDPAFIRLVEYCKSPGSSSDGLIELVTEEKADAVYSFPVFSADYCTMLLEEIEHFECADVPKGRPNTMNNRGVLLAEMGFDESFLNPLRIQYLLPIARLLFPEWVGQTLDSHRAFVVQYSMDNDTGLSYHYDNAEVTLNVCLGKEFTGGDLYFGPLKGVNAALQARHTYQHQLGRGVLHRGRHMHGAHEITTGERCNFIMWMRSSSVRNPSCPMCDCRPQLVPTSDMGDGFTKDTEES